MSNDDPDATLISARGMLSGFSILIVDDDPIIRRIAIELLGNEGARIEVAEDGQAALDALERGLKPDAVLMDVEMPVLNGFRTARRIVEEYADAAPPIVAMTAHTDRAVLQKCFDSGMRNYTLKPFDPPYVFAVLGQVLEVPFETAPDDTSQREISLPERADDIDIAEGVRRVNNNQRLYLALLRQFVDTYRGAASEMRKLLADDDVRRVRHRAHAIHGVAASIGASELGNAAATLETLLRNSDRGNASPSSAERAAADQAFADFAQSLAETVVSAEHLLSNHTRAT